jgi:hypothetical protein
VVLTKIDPDGIKTCYSYDALAERRLRPIPLVTATDGNRAGKSYTYDQFGELQQVTECADGKSFVSSYAYDSLGRQSQIRYPAVKQSQLAVGYHYTASGYLQGGWLLGSTAVAHGNGDNRIQQWSHSFDEIGNLLTRGRTDAVNALTSQETFGYDLTNRLTSANVQMSNETFSSNNHVYDPAGLGNLAQKDGNAYPYGASGGRAAGTPLPVSPLGGYLLNLPAVVAPTSEPHGALSGRRDRQGRRNRLKR